MQIGTIRDGKDILRNITLNISHQDRNAIDDWKFSAAIIARTSQDSLNNMIPRCGERLKELEASIGNPTTMKANGTDWLE